MLKDPSQGEVSVALASGSVTGGNQDTTVALPHLAPLDARLPLPLPRVAVRPLVTRLAVATLLAGAFAVVMIATARPTVLVPRSTAAFPHWMSGPLHGLFGHPTSSERTLDLGFSVVMIAMTAAYLLVLGAVRRLSMRTLVVVVVALHAILLMSPPLQLTDVFNYLGYARLGGLHGLNPYTHVIAQAHYDPVYLFTTWHHLHSPYGQLFTALSYLVAWMPLPVAYWVLKIVTVSMSLVFLALVVRCARQLGRDPRFALAFVALNPVFLMYAIAGFHNDFFMLVPSTAAISLLLDHRDRSAGAAIMVAVAVKFTAILLLPFLLLAARPPARRLRLLAGAGLAAIPLVALILALFGLSLPNLADQSSLLTDFSIPNLVGIVLGLGGGAPVLLQIGKVLVVLTIVYALRSRRDWLVGAGWSTFALIASLAWLVPWYVIWLLPLAALGTSTRLRRAALALTAFLVIAFMPETGIQLSDHGIDLMSGSASQASQALQKRLAQ